MRLIEASPAGIRPERLFRPHSVAVIGATTAAGRQIMANLLGGGFHGSILPVAPGITALSGVLAYSDVGSLPVVPDLALIASDAADVPGAMAALGARGTSVAIVTSMISDLGEVVRATGVRAIGPGSFGLCVPGIGLNASRSHVTPAKGRLALVSQSAALCRVVLDWAEPNGVGFSHVIGIGGNADLGFGLALDWLSRDRDTGAILLDIRQVKDRRRFLSAARAAARLRPVVAIRGGGLLSDPTGAGELATEAALRRAGILSVSGLDDLLTAAETLTRSRPVRNEHPAILTNATGPAHMAANAALRDGLTLAELSPATGDRLRASGPAGQAPLAEGGIVNVGPDEPMRLAEVAAMLAEAPEIGGIVVVHAPTGPGDTAAIEALTACAKTVKVPMLACAMGETTGAANRRALSARGVPAFAFPEQAMRGFLHLVKDRRNRAAARELPPSAVLQVAPDQEAVRHIFARVRQEGRLDLAQDEAMAVLSAYNVTVASSRVAATSDEAMRAAAELGFPVVVKTRRIHKPSEALAKGGLALDLHDEGEVQMAVWSLKARQSRLGHDGPKAGFLVQRQVGRARELLIRVAEDPTFGPTISFGQGGTTADIVHDVAVDLPPLNLPLAHALIARTRAAATLDAFRDMPASNVEAVAKTLVRVSQLIVDFPEIAALDVNPLFAGTVDVQVADAWIRLRAPEDRAGDLAISPYPAELAASWTAPDGEAFTIRPIRPEDAEQHEALFRRLTPDDVRFRFFSAIRELSREQVARMTQVDYDREMAFVAIRERTGEMVGVSRLVLERRSRSGEFAVVVQPDQKRRGLARQLMQRLIDWARQRGATEIVGQVLADNAPMIAFVRQLGFEVHRIPDEDDVVEVKLALEQALPASARALSGGDTPVSQD